MEKLILLIAALLCAMIEWLAVGNSWRKVEYITKPGVMVFLIAWLVLSDSLQQINLIWFTIGAVFSMMGDIYLLLRNERLGFALGLVAFLLAHLAYIAALNYPLTPLDQGTSILAGIVFAIALLGGRRILNGVRKKRLKKLILPITLYIMTIGVMLFSALSTNFRADWRAIPALLAGLGAVSFALSDFCLAWNKFVSPLRYGRLTLMVTYHLGQIAILSGALLQFSQ